jgi:hypothetical protein
MTDTKQSSSPHAEHADKPKHKTSAAIQPRFHLEAIHKHPIYAWRPEAALQPAELAWLRTRSTTPLARLAPAPATYDCLLYLQKTPVLLAAQRHEKHLALFPFLDKPPVLLPLSDAAAMRPVFYE